MQTSTLTFIGGGNMSRALISGLLNDQWPAQHIHVSEPDTAAQDQLRQLNRALEITSSNTAAAEQADVLIFAVKPQILAGVIKALQPLIQTSRPLLISIAAGVRVDSIQRWSGGNSAIVRCMPNTPALVGKGATGLYASAEVSAAQKMLAERLLAAVGSTVWVEEEPLMDAVTALSGSGPAYHFLVMEAMQAAAQQLGLPEATARQLSLETALGSATLAAHSDENFATLRTRVTSKGGTTAAALEVLKQGGLTQLFLDAMRAAATRANELAEQSGSEL
ncbi:MAG TPA: pyrroline-5-carboxylate reductase [Gammaproteobacteria bacterium]|nr:pyrroline-5-carboxylate reductase [Gammaproteobacteria bacterium]